MLLEITFLKWDKQINPDKNEIEVLADPTWGGGKSAENLAWPSYQFNNFLIQKLSSYPKGNFTTDYLAEFKL